MTREDSPSPAATAEAASSLPRDRAGSPPVFPRLLHVHRFRWAREDPFSPHNVYACRCGMARPAL